MHDFLATKIVVIRYTERDNKQSILIWILEQKKDIHGNTSEIQIKSGVPSTVPM